eukprot:gene12444-26183_t
MPYKSKSGKAAPNFCPQYFPKGEVAPGKFVHGDFFKCCCFVCCPKCSIPCPMCWCTPFGIDCSIIANLCGVCRPHCAPICSLILQCEGICQAECGKLCALGPEIPCRAAGCEATCGVSALEDTIGVWHLATDAYPAAVPAILFPCFCVPFPPIPGLGQDETMSGEEFSPGGPTQTKTVKICDFACGPMFKLSPICNPHTALKQTLCGACMEPAFGGEIPCWYCNECKYPAFNFQMQKIEFGPGGGSSQSVHPS